MKRLHLANIANMAYGYAEILRAGGHHSDVLCYDLDHWLSDPSSGLGFKEYPGWYRKVKTVEHLTRSVVRDDWLETLQRYSYRFDEVLLEDLAAYKGYVDAYQEKYFDKYDLIYGYAYGAIPPLLYAECKYVPVDLGSMRGLSERNDSFSRVLKYSLRAAPYVILTNPDVLDDCLQLGIHNYRFIPHPVDERQWKPLGDALQRRNTLKEQYQVDTLILAPARHDWSVKGTDKIIQGVVDFAKRSGSKVKCLFIDWGQEVARSKELIHQLGATEIFEWLPLQSESQLRELYNSVDALIDQVGEATTFGLTTPKAMASGVPVLTAFDPGIHTWCYSEMPPLLAIDGSAAITDHLLRLDADSVFKQAVISDQREWVERFHSSRVIENAFLEAESEFLESPEACKIYYSINQKKNEIVYEEKYTGIYDRKYHDAAAYQQMDQLLVDWMGRHLSKLGGIKILDLGCGPGSMIGRLLEIPGAEVCGVDLSPAFIEMARRRFPNVEFKVGDAEVIPYPPSTFDAVLCSGMLHHIPDLPQVFGEVRRVLKPRGYLFVREPNADNFASRYQGESFVHLVLKHLIHIQQRKPAIVEPEEHEFHIDFNFEELVEMLARHFNVIDLEFGQRVSYFYDMLFGEKYHDALARLESDLLKAPGLNVLVACQATDNIGGVNRNVNQKISAFKNQPLLAEQHLLKLCDFASNTLQTKNSYYEEIFRLAQDFLSLRTGGEGYGNWCRMDIQGGYIHTHKPTPVTTCWERWKKRKTCHEMDWQISDSDGQALFDSGYILLSSELTAPSVLAEALSRFRDYSLIQIALPVGFELEGAMDDEARAVLEHCYVIAEALDDRFKYFIVSPKLFTAGNFIEALLVVAEEKTKTALLKKLSGFTQVSSVDFYRRNLFKLLP